MTEKNFCYLYFIDEQYKNPDEMKNIVIIGASDYASKVLTCAQKEGKFNVVGFIDATFASKTIKHLDFPVLGSLKDLAYLTDKLQLHGGILAVQSNKKRKVMADKIAKMIPNFEFESTVAPSAKLGDNLYLSLIHISEPTRPY